MNITISYDASVNSAPAAFKTDVAAVVAYFESQYTDNISFNLHVGYGEVHGSTMGAGFLGQSYAFYDSFSYSQIKAALSSDATTADDATGIGRAPRVVTILPRPAGTGGRKNEGGSGARPPCQTAPAPRHGQCR